MSRRCLGRFGLKRGSSISGPQQGYSPYKSNHLGYTPGNNLQARSGGTGYLSNTALAQMYRASSMASSWLEFLTKARKTKETTRKNWARNVKVSWRASVKAEDEYIIWFGQDGDGYRAGSVVCSWLKFFFLLVFVSVRLAAQGTLNSAQEGNEEEL